jgi:nucleotide-binding universal stress UspA family protein
MSPEVYDYLDREAVIREKTAREWCQWATHQGVPTDAHLNNTAGYVPTWICAYAAEKNFDLIAMFSQANVFSAAIAGSCTRQVVRGAPCPVWSVQMSESEKY